MVGKARVMARPGLRLRAGPGLRYRILTVMPYGAIVDVEENTQDWWLIRYLSWLGWAYSPYLALVEDPATSLLSGVDLSFSSIKGQGKEFLAACRMALGNEASFVIQNLWTGFITPKPAIENLKEVQRLGLPLSGYIVFNPYLRLSAVMDYLRKQFGGFHFHSIFLDVEPTKNIRAFHNGKNMFTADLIRSWVEAIREAFGTQQVGIYTAQWVWRAAGSPDWSSLAEFHFWVASYDGKPKMGNERLGKPEWGLKIVGKQYRGTTVLEKRWSVDLNVFRAEFWVSG